MSSSLVRINISENITLVSTILDPHKYPSSLVQVLSNSTSRIKLWPLVSYFFPLLFLGGWVEEARKNEHGPPGYKGTLSVFRNH